MSCCTTWKHYFGFDHSGAHGKVVHVILSHHQVPHEDPCPFRKWMRLSLLADVNR
jgi:hypothetical protein